MTGDLSLREIRSFMLVAEMNGFRRDAKQIQISPSALSTHIGELEEVIGVPLLFRTTRNVALTDSRLYFPVRMRPLFSGPDTVIEEFREEADLSRGRLTVACLPTFVATVLLLLVVTLKQRYPGIELGLMDVGYSAMQEAIRRG